MRCAQLCQRRGARPAKTSLRQRAATLAEVARETLTWTDLATAIERGFSLAFDLKLTSARLSAAETERARHLKRERFGSPDWTRKR